MNQAVSVSVVIPTHNRADRISGAVDSALAQTLAPLEVIVVDDASTDGTVEALSRRYGSSRTVRVLRMPRNGGACAARNRGIRAARGAWVAFLDSDDLWDPEKLREQASLLVGSPASVAVFTGLRIVAPGRRDRFTSPPSDISREDLLGENLLSTTSSALVRRDLLAKVGGFDEGLPSCQDWDLYLRVLGEGPAVVSRRPLTIFDDGGHDRISRDLAKVMAGHDTVHSRILSRIADPALRRKVEARHALRIAEILAYQGGRHTDSLRAAARSLLLAPDPEGIRRAWTLLRTALPHYGAKAASRLPFTARRGSEP